MKRNSVKILYFITGLEIGGAEQLLLSIIKNLNKERYNPYVCCFYRGKLANEIESLGIKIYDFQVKSKFDFSVFIKLYFLLKKEKPQILHTHLFHATILGRIVGVLAGIPVIISTQHYSSGFHGRIGMVLEKITSHFAHRIIAVSNSAKEFCVNQEGILAKKIQVIYNGIEVNTALEKKENLDLKKKFGLNGNIIVGCVGRFVKIKGYEYLLYAAPEIVKYFPDVKFILLGYGPLKYKLKKLADALSISDRVVFLGPDIEVNDILSILDVYVLPSLSEGLSITLLEAMSIGIPVIATAAGGNSEVIIHDESGILISPRDYKALAGAVINLIGNNEKAKRLGNNGRLRVVELFNIKENVRKTELLYEELVDEFNRKKK